MVFLTKDRVRKKRGVAKGARRARSRFTGTLEPLTRAGVAYCERELRDLVRINYVETQRKGALSVVAHGTDDAFALGHAEYFAELIDEWAPRGARRRAALPVGIVGHRRDRRRRSRTEALARYFEFWLLRLQGVYPHCRPAPGLRRSLRRGSGDARTRGPIRVFPLRAARRHSGSLPAMHFLRMSATSAPDALIGTPLDATAARELETAHRRPPAPAPGKGTENRREDACPSDPLTL